MSAETTVIRERLERLPAELVIRGLTVRKQRAGALVVRNPAGEPDKGNPHGQALSPGLRQEVACRSDGAGALWWFWVWSGPTRQAPPDLEPLCLADNVEWAADRIARVLAVPFADASADK